LTVPNPPKPTERKRRAGNPGKRKLAEPKSLVLAQDRAPTAPQGLGQAGLVLWRRAWDAGSDWLAPGDVTLLELLCRQVDEIGRWQEVLQSEGLTFQTRNGFIRVHPAVAQIRELEQRVVTNLGLCGFTPADRARLGLTEVRKLSGLADLAARRADAIGR
jgi:P27 family predicted phage terminase small subunit